MPCGVCREFLMQLSSENENTEIMVDYDNRESVTLKELLPKWWGHMRE
jgi:cytidine deaminase